MDWTALDWTRLGWTRLGWAGDRTGSGAIWRHLEASGSIRSHLGYLEASGDIQEAPRRNPGGTLETFTGTQRHSGVQRASGRNLEVRFHKTSLSLERNAKLDSKLNFTVFLFEATIEYVCVFTIKYLCNIQLQIRGLTEAVYQHVRIPLAKASLGNFCAYSRNIQTVKLAVSAQHAKQAKKAIKPASRPTRQLVSRPNNPAIKPVSD